jgi:cytochrome c5
MKKVLFAITLLAGSSVALAAAEDQSREAVSKRIKPVAQLYIGDSSAPAVPAGPRSGEDVFKTNCFACHGTGANGAPKPGDTADWAKRAEQGLDVVLQHAINGFNTMPAKGACMACSDDEIKAAVEFMMK